MNIVYTFATSGGLMVVPLEQLRPASQKYYLSRWPEATHVVQSPGLTVYAVCGSREDAERAKAAYEAVSAKET